MKKREECIEKGGRGEWIRGGAWPHSEWERNTLSAYCVAHTHAHRHIIIIGLCILSLPLFLSLCLFLCFVGTSWLATEEAQYRHHSSRRSCHPLSLFSLSSLSYSFFSLSLPHSPTLSYYTDLHFSLFCPQNPHPLGRQADSGQSQACTGRNRREK